jgi:hypothetical protein
VAVDETVNSIASASAALVALDGKDVELADDLAEDDRALSGHYSHPSTRNANSICAVAVSMPSFFRVCAAITNAVARGAKAS